MGLSVDSDVAVAYTQPPETLLVTAAVELDLSSRMELAAAVDRALRRCPLIIAIDLRPVEFIDSAALATIAGSLHRCSVEGVRGVVVRGPHGQVVRLIELTGMDRLIEFIDAADLPPFAVQLD